ncbi:DUF6876 family protein [Falsiroseomonas sp. CW058]|uniref:DUF6876 family protein n=1 Tax=Falsiroseomonas sp. CW058 TaxID=3388664 RepID=UPI003D319FA5
MTTEQALEEELRRGIQSPPYAEHLINHWTHKVTYTAGVQWLAQRAEAYWLIDAIASWQMSPEVKAEAFQSWSLRRLSSGAAILTCDDGDGRVVARQEIEFTDFPLMEVKLWLENGVLMLPSER